MFEKYSQHVMKHPKTIIAAWIVVLLLALPFAIQSDDILNYDMTSMGGFDSESSDGQAIVDEYFEGSVSSDTILAIPFETDEDYQTIMAGLVGSGELNAALDERYDGAVTVRVMGSYGKEGSEAGVLLMTFEFPEDLHPIGETDTVRAAVSDAKVAAGMESLKTYVTGSAPIANDTMAGADEDIAKIDPLSILLILLLLGLFFWTLVTAAVPPLVVGTAYGIVLALIYALGTFMDIFYITKMIVLVSMLGAGVDYSIFIISRYREERKGGKDKEAALTEAIKWAGESVFTSGMAVIIGFAVMSLCSFSLVSTMAISLAVGIVMAMAAALSLIPALIALVGDRIFWPRSIDDYTGGSRMRSGVYGKFVDAGRRYFAFAGRFSVKHAKAIVAVAILVTVPMAYVAAESEDSFDMISVMPDSEAKEGIDIITQYTDGGLTMPTYALLHLDSPIATVTPLAEGIGVLTWSDRAAEYMAGLNDMSSAITASDENVSYTLGPTSWAMVYQMGYQSLLAAGVPAQAVTPEMVNRAVLGQLPDAVALGLEEFFGTYGWNLAPDTMLPIGATSVPVAGLIDYSVNVTTGLVSGNGEYVQMMVVVKDEPMSPESMSAVDNVRGILAEFADGNEWIKETWVVGTPAVLNDISELVDSEFTMIELGVIVLIYVLLFFVLGVYLTPLRSLATILMSVVWTLGVLQTVFAGMLAIDVIWIVPIVLFVICLGLGMDYDILVTTRIREGKLKGLSNDEAIQDALAKSGSIITLCGLIMGGTFLTLLVSGSSMLQEVGFALGFAILVDSLIVVPYVVPALMHLMGDWSWKGPRFLAGRRGE